MKDVVGIVVTIAMALGGSIALKRFHDTVKQAALKKASQGLPSLTEMTRSLQKQKGDRGEIKNTK
jgi:hypothetical protein